MTGLAKFEQNKFLARKKVFKFLGDAFHIYEPNGSLAFYVKQKAFKLREAITVCADEAQTQPLLSIKARSINDFSGIYDVTTTDGVKVGSLRRKGLASIIRDQWEILDTSEQVIGTVEEDSMALAMVRRFLSNLVPQDFTAQINGETVATFSQHFNPFVAKFDVDFSMDTQGLLDRRLGVAAVVLLLAIEGRQN